MHENTLTTQCENRMCGAKSLQCAKNRVPSLLLTKNSKTFSGPSRTPTTFFQDTFVAHQCLNIQTERSYLLYIYSKCLLVQRFIISNSLLRRSGMACISFTCHPHVYQHHPAQNVHQRNCSVNIIAGILCTFIYTWCAVQKAVFQFQQLIWTTDKFQDFPGPQFNFQDFPVLNSFSRTFQVLEIFEIKIQDFPGFSRRRGNPEKKLLITTTNSKHQSNSEPWIWQPWAIKSPVMIASVPKLPVSSSYFLYSDTTHQIQQTRFKTTWLAGGQCLSFLPRTDWLTELWFYVPLDTK